jgi:hypothetical protein
MQGMSLAFNFDEGEAFAKPKNDSLRPTESKDR